MNLKGTFRRRETGYRSSDGPGRRVAPTTGTPQTVGRLSFHSTENVSWHGA